MSNPLEQLNHYRAQVEDIDYEIHKLLTERFKVTGLIGKVKIELNLPIENLKVEAFKLKAVDPMLKSIYQEIFNVSKQCQSIIE